MIQLQKSLFERYMALYYNQSIAEGCETMKAWRIICSAEGEHLNQLHYLGAWSTSATVITSYYFDLFEAGVSICLSIEVAEHFRSIVVINNTN